MKKDIHQKKGFDPLQRSPLVYVDLLADLKRHFCYPTRKPSS